MVMPTRARSRRFSWRQQEERSADEEVEARVNHAGVRWEAEILMPGGGPYFVGTQTHEDLLANGPLRSPTDSVLEAVRKEAAAWTAHPERGRVLAWSRAEIEAAKGDRERLEDTDVFGRTALLQTIEDRSLADLFFPLLALGADPDRPNSEDGTQPLDAAAASGTAAMVEALLKAGADPNGARRRDDSWGPVYMPLRTALFYSWRNEIEEIVRLLLEGGADPNLLRFGELGAADFIRNAHPKLALLLESGAQRGGIVQ